MKNSNSNKIGYIMAVNTNIDYKKLRIDYISSWPNSNKFPVEVKYTQLINSYKDKSLDVIFKPLKYPYTNDIHYNIALSFMIDALDVLNEHPNFSFDFLFIAIDTYSDSIYSNINITERLQIISDSCINNSFSYPGIQNVFNLLYKYMPNSTCQFLYSCIFESYNMTNDIMQQNGVNKQIIGRIFKRNSGGVVYNQNFADLFSKIALKYGYDYNNYSNSIRKGSRLIYQIFNKSLINIDNNNYSITDGNKLTLLICGILYTMRNDSMHGDGISSFKSSLAGLKTYAHNYYCFLCEYIILTLLIYPVDTTNEQILCNNFSDNIKRYHDIFKNKIIKE